MTYKNDLETVKIFTSIEMVQKATANNIKSRIARSVKMPDKEGGKCSPCMGVFRWGVSTFNLPNEFVPVIKA